MGDEEKFSKFTFAVTDVVINGLPIEGVMLAAKLGDKGSQVIFRALHDFVGELGEIWNEKWGEGAFEKYCESVSSILDRFFRNLDKDKGESCEQS